MQFEKIGRGLLWEAFQSKGECVVSQKRGGGEIITCMFTALFRTDAFLFPL